MSFGTGGGLTVKSGGGITVESGGGITLESGGGIDVESGGNITLSAGGDLIFTGSDSDPGIVKFSGSSSNIELGLNAAGTTFNLLPTADTTCSFYIGSTAKRFANAYVWAETFAQMSAKDDSYGEAFFGAISDVTANRTGMKIINGDGTVWLVFTDQYSTTNPTFVCNPNKSVDLGIPEYAFDDAYADDWNNVADFLFLDSMDDLLELHKIKGSGILDKRTGLELIDDDSLPEWLLAKDKLGEHVVYDPDGKPYISLKTAISHLWGCVKQLDNKVIDLTASIKGKK